MFTALVIIGLVAAALYFARKTFADSDYTPQPGLEEPRAEKDDIGDLR